MAKQIGICKIDFKVTPIFRSMKKDLRKLVAQRHYFVISNQIEFFPVTSREQCRPRKLLPI